jgi:hypothetical protein
MATRGSLPSRRTNLQTVGDDLRAMAVSRVGVSALVAEAKIINIVIMRLVLRLPRGGVLNELNRFTWVGLSRASVEHLLTLSFVALIPETGSKLRSRLDA